MEKKSTTVQLETALEGVFKKLPPLSANAVNTLYSITPWLALIFGVIGLLTGIAAFGLLSVFGPFALMAGVHNYGTGIIASVGLVLLSVMMLVAFPGLKAGKKSGWTLLFWGEIIGIATSIIGISLGSVITDIIGLYLLFQIKPKYK